MDINDDIKGFFVENEDKFTEEQLLNSINRLKKYAKLIGREGRVYIEGRNLSGTNKLKLLLIVRYLGSELAKLKPELKINPNIKSINSSDISDFLSVDDDNARARMYALCKEGFAKKTVKGKVEVEPFQVERFIDDLEKGIEIKEKPPKNNQLKKRMPMKKQLTKVTEQSKPEINPEEIYERLAKTTEIDKSKIEDVIYIKKDGSFKFNTILGNSKYAKQRVCILLSAYVYRMGFGHETFNSRIIKDICFNSMIDKTDLNQTIKQLKLQGLISKEGRRSQDNIIREKGMQQALDLFKELIK